MKIKATSSRLWGSVKHKLKQGETRIRRFPMFTLGLLLVLLFAAIVASDQLRQTPEIETQETPAKKVSIFSVGEAPRVNVLAEVEKTGVVTIVAQSAGVVRNITVDPGDEVSSGKALAYLSTNYTGGNVFSLQRQIAQEQYQNVLDTYDAQKEVLDNQKRLAELQDENNDELRDIQEKSIGETKDLIELNESILETIDETINTSTNSAEIQASKQLKAQLLSGVLQLRAQLRSTEYQEDSDNPPAQLSDVQKKLTLKQLEIQAQALDLQKEVSRLQVQVARVQESLMYPAAPYPGVIERIHVREGQVVSPGTPIATLFCDIKSVRLVAKVSRDIAQRVSLGQPSQVLINDQVVEIYPYYISQVATDGQLYSVQYMLPQEWIDAVTDQGAVSIEIPVGFADTASTVSFVPIDSVHQLQQSSLLYVLQDGEVVAKQVELGTVQGRFVEVSHGLEFRDQIILDRNVIAGEKVESL